MNAAFEGRHVAVTGATGALGAAVIKALAAAGAIVHAPVRRREAPPELTGVTGIEVAPGVDIGDEESVRRFYAALPELWASVHTIGGFAMAPILETSLADFDAQHRLNAASAFLCCREAVRAMGDSGGRIVNVTARPVLEPVGGMIAYAASKASVASLTRCLAREVAARGILVNAVVPSIIDSPANRAAMPKADHSAWPRPEQIAQTIAFLSSPQNALTSGTLVPVYGRA